MLNSYRSLRAIAVLRRHRLNQILLGTAPQVSDEFFEGLVKMAAKATERAIAARRAFYTS